MNKNFSRIITLLRKERGLSQKQASSDLNISQALLSHYEKGVRECGLDFVIKLSEYYNVSCDYLLGKTPERNGAKLTVDDIPDPNLCKDNVFKGSILPTLNKKLISNSINIIFDLLQKVNNKSLTTEASSYLMLSIYKVFRYIYSINPKNPQGIFDISKYKKDGLLNASLFITDNNLDCITSGINTNEFEKLDKKSAPLLSSEIISKEYPLFSSSLHNLIQRSEQVIKKETDTK